MKSAKTLFVLTILAMAFAAGASAQNMPGEYLLTYNINVRPGSNAQFEDYVKKVHEAAEKTGATQTWGAGQITIGGPLNAYLIALQVNKLSEMDAWEAVPAMLKEAFGEDEGAKIFRSGTSAIESSSTTMYRLMKDASYNLKSAQLAPRYQIRVSKIHREMDDEYRLFLDKVNAVFEKQSDPRTVIRRVSMLGNTGVYWNATPFDNWAMWDDQNFWAAFEKTHGEAETRRMQDLIQRCVESSKLFVLTLRPDLSRTEAGTTSN